MPLLIESSDIRHSVPTWLTVCKNCVGRLPLHPLTQRARCYSRNRRRLTPVRSPTRVTSINVAVLARRKEYVDALYRPHDPDVIRASHELHTILPGNPQHIRASASIHSWFHARVAHSRSRCCSPDRRVHKSWQHGQRLT